MDRIYRLLALGLLLVLTAGVCVQYATTDHWSYPSPADIASDPEAYDGQSVLLFGEVRAIDETGGRMGIVTGDDPAIELQVRDVPPAVIDQIAVDGSAVQVYGTLGEGGSVVVADEIVVDFRHTTDRLYTYGVSILGGLLATLYFLWYWRVDLRRLRIVPRGDR